MKLTNAGTEHTKQIYQLVQNTIKTVYPLYYPKEITEFFCSLHSEENIASDIQKGIVKVLSVDNCLVGTGTCEENHIKRLFVVPACRKRDTAARLCKSWKKK